jgi:hypothetical protein
MNMMSSAVESKVEQLLAVLDEDNRHLETTLSQLDAVRGLLIKRDDAALERLLGEIRGRTEAYAANERKRQRLRADLALMLERNTGRFTLSKLESMLPEPQRTAVASRREKLRSLIQELKREYTLTTLLVSDCARFNRTLIRTLFGTGRQTGVIYSPSGEARQQTNTTLVSLQL